MQNMNEDLFKTKTNLDPAEYKNLFGDPFWNEQGSLKARNFYFQLNEKQKALILKKNYLEMIKKARERNYNMAADCLQWWLDGTGFSKTIDFNWLRRQREIIAAENLNLDRFAEELEKYGKSLKKEGDFAKYDAHFEHLVKGGVFGELYYTSGDSTLSSHCYFKITKKKNNFLVTGIIKHFWWDSYDWHKGANAYIPSFGYVKDSDALLLETYCGARPFEMKNEWQQSFNKTFESGFLDGLSINLK